MDTTPIYGCDGCKTTGGRLSCYKHGQITFSLGGTTTQDDWGHAMCPKHKEEFTCEKCTKEFIQQASHFVYRKLGMFKSFK